AGSAESHFLSSSGMVLGEMGLCLWGLWGRSLTSTPLLESTAMCEVYEGTEEMTEPLQQCMGWLYAYFCEPARTATLPVPAFHHPLLQQDSFTSKVLWTLLREVKFGEAVSYKHLADLAGNSKAARAVGGAMRSNPIPIIIPCHRVICSSGRSGNYGGGNLMKEWLLSHEKGQPTSFLAGSPLTSLEPGIGFYLNRH
uniref:Methylated-DNA--protein-cysteine methyltransferase n=1 Tax=Amazona collaria TaxID=241587 RepID=A0A8B9FXL5_9PSIT